ncbi:hypothetical protein SCLCIDRAFT_132966, partial [Scleroderma citrinum Foug A]
HCKAGHSCSIAAVMAYLTHAHHWPHVRTRLLCVAAAAYPQHQIRLGTHGIQDS